MKAAIGVVSFSGSTSIAIPRGGRPLVIASSMPAARRRSTAWQAPSVSTLPEVTSVPSTSAISSLTGARPAALEAASSGSGG